MARANTFALIPAFVTAFVALLLSAQGCGSRSALVPQPQGATVATELEDLPVCDPSMLTTPPPVAAGTPYHVGPGATDADRFFLALLQDDADSLAGWVAAGVSPNSVRAMSVTIEDGGLVRFGGREGDLQPSALHWAARYSRIGDTIRVLLANGADISARDASGSTPLLIAAKNEVLAPAGLQALLDARSDIHAVDKDGRDAMLLLASSESGSHAVLCLQRERLRLLMHAGLDINENRGYTPLMVALSHRNLGMAKLIRAMGGSLGILAAADGGTALHVVARAADDRVETVKWLLSRGINVHVRDHDYKTALDLFRDDLATHPSDPGFREIIALLERHHKR